MPQDEIGVGIIGTGFGVRVQLPLWQHTPGARVTAVCSHDAGRAQQVADRFGLSHAATDYAELAELSDVDLVSVVTSPDLHYSGAMAAIEAGKHVLCEKPFALDEAQAREMWEAAKAKGVAHMVNFEFRTTPARVRMREMIQDGFLGSLNHVHTTSFGNFVHWTEGRTASWWYGAKTGGGWLGASGSHTLDAMRWLFGEIVAVNATLETFAKEHKPIDQPDHIVADADDTFFLTLRFENGALGAFLSSAAAPTGTGAMRLEAHGADGTLVLDGDRLLGAKKGDALTEVEVEELPDPPVAGDQHYKPFFAWTNHIVAALSKGEKIEPSFEDGWRSQRLLDAARASSEAGRWVECG